jgi:DNA polymerase-3 subunit epsilon
VSLTYEVPRLLVGFDIESTGLDTGSDEAISYGFAEFRHGLLAGQDQFFVLPDVQIHPAAERVHGVSFEKLRVWRRQEIALSARAGAHRALQVLLSYAARRATFVGANPIFDYTMLDATLQRHGSPGLLAAGFDFDRVLILDVVSHDLEMETSAVPRRRGLTKLCEIHGVTPGHHVASEDARAACEVLIAQIRQNDATVGELIRPGGASLEGRRRENAANEWLGAAPSR